ncbi:hypothetical protein U729_3232 (plasmid) [Clostridium baratii str. Sullivan]|uniref:Uncharacterized protein n=1 Tax=Clostridium baratii str. Sullivan TaxID=1415775 RepID=A0A0A7G0B7_9CLOT|nr:hypothetical protein [Clostridium baratii]AIY85282.1 hypothetical protein U729_3232 [Clostridium baratii str. Sullivan]
MAQLGKILGQVVLMFGTTFVTKKVIETAGKKSIASILGLAGYSCTAMYFIDALLVLKGNIGGAFESLDLGKATEGVVDSLIESVKNAILK